jgi:hypothetical protein
MTTPTEVLRERSVRWDAGWRITWFEGKFLMIGKDRRYLTKCVAFEYPIIYEPPRILEPWGTTGKRAIIPHGRV